jgi:hypothetical protein
MGVPVIDRLLDLCSESEDGCWIYSGRLTPQGYVRVKIGSRGTYGHRITWEHFIGEWPEGLTFDHLCRQKACLNPWHGDPVPGVVNSRRAPGNIGVMNAAKTHCPEGHPLSGDNLRFATRGSGRVCRTCRMASSAKYRNKNKEMAA